MHGEKARVIGSMSKFHSILDGLTKEQTVWKCCCRPQVVVICSLELIANHRQGKKDVRVCKRSWLRYLAISNRKEEGKMFVCKGSHHFVFYLHSERRKSAHILKLDSIRLHHSLICWARLSATFRSKVSWSNQSKISRLYISRCHHVAWLHHLFLRLDYWHSHAGGNISS